MTSSFDTEKPPRDRGARLGRPAKLAPQQQEEVIRTVRDGSRTAADAARLVGLHRSNIAHFTGAKRVILAWKPCERCNSETELGV